MKTGICLRTASMCAAIILTASCAAAEPVDGFCWANAWWAPTYSSLAAGARYWEGGVVPSGGGVGYFTGKQLADFGFDGSENLRGLDFGDVQYVAARSRPRISGSLTLSGDAFISGTGRGTAATGNGVVANLSASVRGTGDNVFTKKESGTLLVSTPLSNFGTVAAGGGRLESTATSGTLFSSSGTQAVRGGFLSWAPALASGASASASMLPVTYGPRGGGIVVAKGSGASATLSIPSLAPEDGGATLWVRASGGTNTLGAAEKVLVSDMPALVNGLLDPGIVTHDESTESWPVLFTTYDAARGIVPVPASSMADLASAADADVAVVSSDTTLSSSKRVTALVVENSSALSIASGATLSVGDGDASHPAGVIFNHNVQKGQNVAMNFAGAGTLDFGASPGVIWTSMPTMNGWGPNRSVVVATKITGGNGVTFATHDRGADNTAGYFQIGSGFAQWSGPTRIEGGMLWVNAQDALPAGDIYVLGGTGYGGAQFRPNAGGWTFNQNFYFAGSGPRGDGDCAFWLQNGTTTLNGQVTLLDDTAFRSANASQGGVSFAKGVRGPGSLILKNGGSIAFGGVNTFDSLVVSGSSSIRLAAGATFGAGRMWFKSGNHGISFARGCSVVSTNEFRLDSGTLAMSADNGRLSFAKPAALSSLSLANFSSMAIGGRWEVDAIAGCGARDATLGTESVTASAGGGTLALGSSANAVLATSLRDGAGTLGFAKRGSGTLELPADDTRAYTGATTVEEGTLKLTDDPRLSSSLLYWLDASCEEDFTLDAETGVVSEWRSRGGSLGMVFSRINGTPTRGTAAQVNGLDVVTTKQAAGDVADRLAGSASVPHRTVFVVARARSSAANAGLIGNNGQDIGHRMSSAQYWQPESGSWTLNTTGTIRLDGEDTSRPAINVGSTRIITLVHDRDDWPSSVSWGGKTVSCDFTPAIGWYFSQRYFDGDYCEILAFDRVLSEHEKRFVENYLSEKWLGRTLHDDTLATSPIPAASALRVETGATLDLAGVSATVASLTGTGTITNSSATAATLTVTGSADFTGRIGGAVTVATASNASITAQLSDGVTLAPGSGSSLTAGTHLLTPPTDGLAYWCDAAARETVLEQSGVGVTSWVSRAASSSPSLVLRTGAPVYEASALGGRPALRFGTGGALMAKTASPVRTVFLVAALSSAQSSINGLWGVSGLDIGFRFSGGTSSIEGDDGHVRPTLPGSRVCLDGVPDNGSAIAFGIGQTHVFSARLEGSDAYFGSLGLGTPSARGTAIGQYVSSNNSFVGLVGEVIAYDRVLTDGEMEQVEAYLAQKWQVSEWTEGNAPAESESAFGAGVALDVADGAAVNLGLSSVSVTTLRNDGAGGSIFGDLAITGEFVVDATGRSSISPLAVSGSVVIGPAATATVLGISSLEKGTRHDALTATDGISGDFASVSGLAGSWRTGKSGNAWYLDAAPFVLILR